MIELVFARFRRTSIKVGTPAIRVVMCRVLFSSDPAGCKDFTARNDNAKSYGSTIFTPVLLSDLLCFRSTIHLRFVTFRDAYATILCH